MKKIMSSLALIFCIIGIVGYGFKLMHWPASGILLGLGTLGLLVLWVFWVFSKKFTLFNLVFFLFGVTFFVGFLFKAMHWPGAGILLGILPITAVLLLTLEMMKKE